MFGKVMAFAGRVLGIDPSLRGTGLALVEEAIATTMTNLAPLFGVRIGEAYITDASGNVWSLTGGGQVAGQVGGRN